MAEGSAAVVAGMEAALRGLPTDGFVANGDLSDVFHKRSQSELEVFHDLRDAG